MRVANKSIYEMVKYNLSQITDEMSRANKVISSGKRITELSDDPVGLVQSLHIRSALSGLEQTGRNISLGESWLSAAESSLTEVQTILSNAKALCVQMASGTTGPGQRASAALTVQNMLEEVISLANTEVAGRYIFSGSRTEEAPFEQDGTYRGNNTSFSIKIGRDATIEIGQDGEPIFSDIFTALNDLKSALETNDVDRIGSALGDLDEQFQAVTRRISEVGSRRARMEIKGRILEDLKLGNRERLSVLEDADIAEAIVELKSIELAYQAALTSSSKIMTLSLMDYL